LDRVLWILTPLSPHKSRNQVAPLEQRIELVHAALVDMPEFEFSDVDISRPAPYYAIDTIRILQKQYPGAELTYIMGGDSLQNLPGWFDAQAFVHEISKIGVLRRPDTNIEMNKLEEKLPELRAKVSFFQAPLFEISGQDIRNRIQNNRPYKFFLLPAVFDCINKNKFYKDNQIGN